MNKICIVHSSANPGGIEVLMPQFIIAMPAWDFHVFVLRPPCSDLNVYASSPIEPVYGHTSNLKAAFSLWKFARAQRGNVFHVFNVGPFFLFILRLAGISRLVYSIRGTIYWKTNKEKWLRKLFWHLAIKKRFVFIANSEFSREVFLRKIKGNIKIRLIYNPFNINRFSPDGPKEKNSGKKIIYSGRLASGKNLELWLHLVEAILKKHPDYEFEIYGEGPLRTELQQKALDLNLAGKVAFMGFVKDMERVYRESLMLLFLSEYESFGNAVVESILCGTPVIVSDIPSMKEIFRDFPQFLVSLDENLEKNVLDRLEESDKLNALAFEACESFRQRFSFDIHVEKMENIYKNLS